MADDLGSMSYEYRTLSRLSSETRSFTGIGSFPINYAYNLANQLFSITDFFGAQVWPRRGKLTGGTRCG